MSLEELNRDTMDRSTARSNAALPTKVGNPENASPNIKQSYNRGRRRGGGSQSGHRANFEYQAQPRKTSAKYPDKRPKNRGYYSERPKEEVTEDLRTEHGSVLRMGSKKTNLNHLLNFSVGSRENEAYENRFSASSNSYRNKNKKWLKRTVKYNKEQFLQANCQFVVKDSGDYTVNFADPDILVDWTLIEQVKIFGNQVPSCPICLYPPVAAKMTRCGHIYCWSCILHYLSLSDHKTWRKCPICYEAIHEKDLKSVMASETRSYNVGDEITMSLMKREKGTYYTIPLAQWTQRQVKPNYVDDDIDLCFSKLLIANVDQVQRILDGEKAELDAQMIEHKGTLEGSYVQAALDSLKERQVNVSLSKAAREANGQQMKQVKPRKGNTYTPLQKLHKNESAVEYSCAFSDEEAGEIPVVHSAPNLRLSSDSSEDNSGTPEAVTIMSLDGHSEQVPVEVAAEELALPEDEGATAEELALQEEEGAKPKKSTSSASSDAFYFYQASDGQHIYLHAINARCLVREYGSLDKCPKSITAKIVDLEGISMNEDLRSRLRYLAHLPLTCEFKVAELSLHQPLLSKETLQDFAGEIEKRKRQRIKKKRDETRLLKKMQHTECKKYEHCPEMRAFVSKDYFTENKSTIIRSEMPDLVAGSVGAPAESFSSDFLTPVGSPASSDVGGAIGESPPPASTDDGGQASMSFAQMLRAGKAKPPSTTRPSLDTTTERKGEEKAGDSDSDSEDRIPVPDYQHSFGDAIMSALQNYSKSDDTTATKDASNSSKKKKKKKLLFVNTMARR